MLLRYGKKQVGEWHFFMTMSSIYAHSKKFWAKNYQKGTKLRSRNYLQEIFQINANLNTHVQS